MTLKFKEKQSESKSNDRGKGSGDGQETSENDGNQGSKKDDTLTSKTTSDTKGGFIVEVSVPKKTSRLHRIRIDAPMFSNANILKLTV